MKDEGFGSGSLLLSFLLGGVVGAGMALLLAPQAGEETRRKIKELADDIKDKTNEYINETREKVTAAADEGRGYYDEKKSLVKAAIEAGKDAYEREKEKFAKG
jgi:gas vesicle protein